MIGVIPEARAQNTAPTVATNTGSTTDEGTNDAITQSELEVTDSEEGPSSLTYTIDADVSEGQLYNTNTSTQLNRTSTFTQADINAGYIEYRHDGTEPVSEGFDFTVTDGSGGSVSDTFPITINQVNDPPTISGDLAIATSEGMAVTLTSTDLEANDPDDSASNLTFTVTSAPANGTIEVNGSAASSFTEADVNSGNVDYVHDGSATASDDFDVELADGDGATSAVSTVSVAISSPTVVTNKPLSLLQGNTVTIPKRLLETTDPESGPSSLTYMLDTDVSNGTILKNGSGLSSGDTFTQADINDGNIAYQHNGTSTRSDGFDFTVTDGDGRSASATFTVVTSPAPYGSGRALTLDGTDDYVGLPDESAFDLTGDFTISFWMKVDGDGFNDEWESFVTKGDNAWRVHRYRQESFLAFSTDHGGTDTDLQGSAVVDDGHWHHVAAVYDRSGGEKRLYVDGQLDASTSESRAVDTDDSEVRIGSNAEQGRRELGGEMDEVRIYDAVLSQNQIREQARRTVNVESSMAQDLVSAYRFDDGATAYDVIAGRDGTLQDNASFTSVSGAGLGQASAVLGSGSQTLGPFGGSVAVGNVSTSGNDELQVYQYGTTSGTTFDGNEPGEDFSGTSASKRLNIVWGLEPIGNSPSADVTLDYSQMQGLSNPDNVRLLKRSGPGDAWQNVSGNWTWDSANQTFSRSGVSSFSQYAIGEASTALPVELAYLEATLTDGSGETQSKRGENDAAVRLTWKTASEQNNAGFEVQRRVRSGSEGQTQASSSAAGWKKLGFVESKTDGGTTTEPKEYTYVDAVAFSADTLEYRLRQVDTDGSKTLSEPVTVARRAVGEVQLLGTYPNPARSQATVRFAIPEDTDSKAGTLRLYDVLGRQVRTVRTTAEGGRHKLTLQTDGLSSGVYVLRLEVGSTYETQRLTVVR